MKRLLLLVATTAILVAPLLAQTKNDISIAEFRQNLVDLGAWVDARKGTDFARQFQAMDDDLLMKLYPAVPNGRKFQTLVRQLKLHKFAVRSSTQAGADSGGAAPMTATPMIVTGPGACGAPNTIIQNGGACTPAYPDPNDGAWQIMVAPLESYTDVNGVPAFSPNDNADVSSQGCSLDAETVLQQINVILSGIVNSASPVCNIIPAPINAACWGPVAAIESVNSVFGGYFLDCIEQDGLVNGAKVDAAFQNTVTIYNALGSNSGTTLAADIANSMTGVTTDITNSVTALGTDISSSTTALAGDIGSSTVTLATDLTNVDTDVDARIATLTSQLQTDYSTLNAQITALAAQLTQGTALLDATLRQIMKLQLTPSGQTVIDPPILSCTGSNCPNVLATCQAKGTCSWNNVGPLP